MFFAGWRTQSCRIGQKKQTLWDGSAVFSTCARFCGRPTNARMTMPGALTNRLEGAQPVHLGGFDPCSSKGLL